MTCCLRVSAPLSPASGEGCIDGSCSSRSTPKERIVAFHEKLSGAPGRFTIEGEFQVRNISQFSHRKVYC